MDNKFTITTLHNLDEAYELWKECGIWTDAAESPREASYKIYYLKHPARFYAIYGKGEILIGTAILFFDGRKGSIYRLAIKENYRRRGIATKIVLKAEEDEVALGAGTLYVLVIKNETRSINLVTNNGYQEQADAVYFTKTIGS